MLSESCLAFKDREDGARGGRKGRRREHVAGAVGSLGLRMQTTALGMDVQ